MLTKETQKQAQEIREKIKPLLKKSLKLMAIYKKANNDYLTASNVARVWQFQLNNEYDLERAKMTTQQAEQVKVLRESNPHEWHEQLQAKYERARIAENAENVARCNLVRYNDYICKYFAFLLRPYWLDFYAKKGFESLAEYISETMPQDKYGRHTPSLTIYRDGGSVLESPLSEDGYIYLKIILYSYNYSTKGEEWTGFYNRQGINYEEPQAPKILTLKQYNTIIAKINDKTQKVETLYREQRAIIESYSMHYFCKELKSPIPECWERK